MAGDWLTCACSDWDSRPTLWYAGQHEPAEVCVPTDTVVLALAAARPELFNELPALQCVEACPCQDACALMRARSGLAWLHVDACYCGGIARVWTGCLWPPAGSPCICHCSVREEAADWLLVGAWCCDVLLPSLCRRTRLKAAARGCLLVQGMSARVDLKVNQKTACKETYAVKGCTCLGTTYLLWRG